MSRLVYQTTEVMKKNKIVFYVYKEVQNALVDFILMNNQQPGLVSIVSNAYCEVKTGKKLDLRTKDGREFLREGLRTAVKMQLNDLKIPEEEERDFKFMFNMEYSFSGTIKREKGCNYKKKFERFFVPLFEYEIRAFGEVLYQENLF